MQTLDESYAELLDQEKQAEKKFKNRERIESWVAFGLAFEITLLLLGTAYLFIHI